MMTRRTFFVPLICLSITVFSFQTLSQAANANRTAIARNIEGSQLNRKIAESLNICWRSMIYAKAMYNPAFISTKQRQPKAESLTLSCEIDMPDSGPVLTMCPDVVIEQITDSRGGIIEIESLSSPPRFYRYKPLFPRGFIQAGRSRPEQSSFEVELDAGLHEQVSGKVGIKGYLYAIVAESFDYVDLPFEPNDSWVSVTPDVEVRVREARNGTSWHRFNIEQRPQNVSDLTGVCVGDFLPSRLVMDRQIIVQTSATGAGGGTSSGRIGGRGSGTGRAEEIRFTVAVNPAHRKIPFELEQIPLPASVESAPSHPAGSNQTEPTAFKRMPEQTKPQLDQKVANCFEVDWSSIIYSKTLTNPPASANSKDQFVSERLYVRCQAKILDPELIVGTCDRPVIERIIDGEGRDTDISRAQPQSNRMYYLTPRYRPSLIPTPPSKLIQLEGEARTALGLPLLPRHRPKRTLELQPVHLRIELDPVLLRQDSGEIGSIKGYFHALTAKSLRHVEVPFRSSDKWTRLTPDVEIQLLRARQTGLSSQYGIKQRWQAGRHVSRLLVGDRWPNEIVVDLQFMGTDGKSNSLRSMGGRQLPASISSSGTISGRQVEKIDFVVAVDPNHNRIPFELEHIPLPKP